MCSRRCPARPGGSCASGSRSGPTPEVVLADRTHTYVAYNRWERSVHGGQAVRDRDARTRGAGEAVARLRRVGPDDRVVVRRCCPSQRDVVAAYLVPHFAHRLDSRGNDGPLLPLLAEADGPVGVGMHLALAYGLGVEAHGQPRLRRRRSPDRWPPATSSTATALGEITGQLLERGDLVLNRVVPAPARRGPFRRRASGVGATDRRVASTVDAQPGRGCVELAVELAQQLKPGGAVDGLAEVAARKGSSKAVVQAKRLVSALGTMSV